MNKPVVLCDLDDTLFQTKRKMLSETQQQPVRVAAYDRELKPRSFMSVEQTILVDWLLATVDLIPVTARGMEETARVTLPFSSWKVMTHGAVITQPDGTVNREWQEIVLHTLSHMHDRLITHCQFLSEKLSEKGINAWCRMNYEYNETPVYFVMKHRDSTKLQELYAFHQQMIAELDTTGFYIHQNGNNIAWIPVGIQKGVAVEWLLHKLRIERGAFPVVGLGDSLSDYRFMQYCHWFGMPAQSQFAEAITEKLFYGGKTL